MACGCGGSNAGQGGCGDVKTPPAAVLETELAHELAAPAVSAVVEQQAADAESLLIASSEQEWPRIRVNGVTIAPEAMAQELQYHPAASREEALFLASQALVIRELLQQRIGELGLLVVPQPGQSEEEAATALLIEREVLLPECDEASCQRYYQSNSERYATAPLLAARHILLECAPEDAEARTERFDLVLDLRAADATPTFMQHALPQGYFRWDGRDVATLMRLRELVGEFE